MAHDHINACRDFYAKGGYTEAPSPHMDRVRKALYASQYYADGGRVTPLQLAYMSQYFADGGRVKRHRSAIERDTEVRKWLSYAGLMGGVT